MKLTLMQPYFFPYIGYFMLIKHSDKFVIFDTAQYIRRGWINRNRILKLNGDSAYINALIHKSPRETLIKDIKLNNSEQWKAKILAQLEIYKKIAPYYNEVMDLLSVCLEYETDSLADFNEYSLRETCKYLNIPCDIVVLSKMDLKIDKTHEPDEWGLNISKAMGANKYLNSPGGVSFFDKNKYIDSGIDLKFIKPNLREYNQKRQEFVPGLSIIDVMMFNSVEYINVMIDDYEIL